MRPLIHLVCFIGALCNPRETTNHPNWDSFEKERGTFNIYTRKRGINWDTLYSSPVAIIAHPQCPMYENIVRAYCFFPSFKHPLIMSQGRYIWWIFHQYSNLNMGSALLCSRSCVCASFLIISVGCCVGGPE